MIQPDERLLRPCDTIDQVFAAIESRTAQCGLVPLFNTTSGLVSDSVVAIVRRLVGGVDGVVSSQRSVLDEERRPLRLANVGLAVPTTQLCISESMVVSIQHCLVSWGTLGSIRRVSSKWQALEQCQQWLDQNLPEAARMATDSSAAALADLQCHPEHAAIVSRSAAVSLQAPLCVEAIQDQSENATEFVVVQLDAERKPILRLRQAASRSARFEYLITEVATGTLDPAPEWTDTAQAPSSQVPTSGESRPSSPGPMSPGPMSPGSTSSGSTSSGSMSPASPVLGPWSGRLYWEGGWYETCKRQISEVLPADRPWTGEMNVSAESALQTPTQTGRQWRLGMG